MAVKRPGDGHRRTNRQLSWWPHRLARGFLLCGAGRRNRFRLAVA
jgi:hypothetical protein